MCKIFIKHWGIFYILHPLDVENGIYEVFRFELYCESTPSLESFGDRLEVNDRQ